VRLALQEVVSIAALLITTEVVIADKANLSPTFPGGMGGMGMPGMGGMGQPGMIERGTRSNLPAS